MEISSKMETDLTVALKAHEQVKVDTLRMAITALKNTRIAKMKDLELADEIEVLRKEVKKRQEAIMAFEAGGRADSAEKERQEAEILNSYLPAMMSEDELREIVKASAGDGANFGQVMGKVMAQVKGKADGDMVSKIVKEILG